MKTNNLENLVLVVILVLESEGLYYVLVLDLFIGVGSKLNSGAPYLRKFGNLSIQEILVIT